MKITQITLQAMTENREKFAVLTCYDATFATVLENAGVDVLLVGDSLGNVLHGSDTTLDDMLGIISQGKKPRFVKDFMQEAKSISEAAALYVQAVKTGQFPGKEHQF